MLLVMALTSSLLAAAPPSLRAATGALDDLKYDEALKLLPTADSVQGYSRDEVLEWWSTRALAELGLKREADAVQSFRRLFALAPDWVLPDQYGPRVRTLVGTARADAVRAGTLSLRFEGGLLISTSDPFDLGAELEVSWREPGGAMSRQRLPLVAQQPAPWPKETRLEVWGRVLGLRGSTLVTWGSENAPTRLEPIAVVRVEGPVTTSSRGLGKAGLAGLIVGGAGLLSAGLGVGFAVSSQDAQQALTSVTRDENGRISSLTQRDAFALDRRVQTEAGVATGLFVASAALVAVSAGLVLFDRVTASAGPGGAVVMVPLDAHFAFAGVSR